MGRTDPKSRLGCAQCKRRKCNEALPACSNCIRRKERCSYLVVTSYLSRTSITPSSNNSSTESRCVEVDKRSSRTMLEIELTHFFLIHTLPSIISSPIRQNIWRRVIFAHSFKHSELLDCHLATAALHKYAVTRSSEQSEYSECLQFAADRQASVLATFVPMLSAPSADTALSLFAISAMATIWAFASGSLPSRVDIAPMLPFGVATGDHSTPDRVTNLITIINISRGIQAVIHQCRSWLNEQGMADMIVSPEVSMQPAPDACDALDGLLKDLRHDASITESQLAVYVTGVDRTKYFLQRVAGDVSKEVVLGWPVGLPQPFVDALSQNDPVALVILAFWAASLHDTQRIQWWAVGWGRNVVAEIESVLKERWRRHLEWPLMMVRTPERFEADATRT